MNLIKDKKVHYLCEFLVSLASVGIFFLLCPYQLEYCHMGENSLNFYYLTEKYPIYKCLLFTDAGYLPLIQRLIAVFFVKVCHLGVNSLYAMQLTGMILDGIAIGCLCLPHFSKLGPLWLRVVVSLFISVLFSQSTVCTYFNFIYMGCFLMALFLICDINRMSLKTFVTVTILSMLICLSKGCNVVFLPFSLIVLILFHKQFSYREKLYFLLVGLASFVQLILAAFSGGVTKNIKPLIGRLLAIDYKVVFLLGVILIVFFFSLIMFTVKKVVPFLTSISRTQRDVVMLSILTLGSLCMLLVAIKFDIHGIIESILNWNIPWFYQGSFCIIIMLLLLANSLKTNVGKNVSVFLLLSFLVLCMSQSYPHSLLSGKMVSWDTYKDYFDKTAVPVFQGTERMGTLADDLELYYHGQSPYDNYEYGAPYSMCSVEIPEFDYQDKSILYSGEIALPNELIGKQILSIYIDCDEEYDDLKMKCYNHEGDVILDIPYVTPNNSQTKGFMILDWYDGSEMEKIKVVKSDGSEIQIGENIIFISKREKVE